MAIQDLRGKKINHLTVFDYSHKITKTRSSGRKYNLHYWWTICDCGKRTVRPHEALSKERVFSCGCTRTEKAILKDLARRKPNFHRLKNQKFLSYKQNAKKRKLTFELDFDKFVELITSPCVYCKAEHSNTLKSLYKTEDFKYNGIDRVDNNIGYTVDNCVSCCFICNSAKTDLTLQDFLQWIERLKKYA